MKKLLLPVLAGWLIGSLTAGRLMAQSPADKPDTKAIDDTTYLHEVEIRKEPAKVLHAEPLYVDLIRDLGARKGEREWNVGIGLTDRLQHDQYVALVEYEWAPLNRLGLEVELPFTFYTRNTGFEDRPVPANRLESLKTAFQYSFFVSQRWKTSIALGYINQLELVDLNRIGQSTLITGNVYNPFFVVAKRWGNHFHSLVYTGPRIAQQFGDRQWHSSYETHTSFHCMLPGTRNFLGVEFNKYFGPEGFDVVIRPQMRVSVADNLLVGIVRGIPISRVNERLSSFIRLIYEPRHRH